MGKISIVVPLHNEEESLPLLVKAIAGVLDPLAMVYEIIFVDDGSTDSSFRVLCDLHKQYNDRIRVIRFSRNYGKSAALSVGIREATGDIIVTMDADLQDDPVAIPEMLKKIDEGWDVVSGWKKKRYDPVTFTFPSKIWNFVTSILSGVKLHDFNCGFKAYRAQAAKSLDIYGDRHRYLPALAHWEGFRVTEIEVPHHARQYGKSKYGFSKFFNGIFDMLTLLFLRRYLRSPLHFFGPMGLFLMVLGSSILGYFVVEWLVTGAMHVRPLMVFSGGSVIVGIQFLSFGFLAEMLAHSSRHEEYKIRERLS
ncbi:MAG: glycosyltransferase family 2 protein [Fibrobacter sp.]|mgnify:FL=1|nr:glycosyltransferase family 2 protein [Fibrobacter sp.]